MVALTTNVLNEAVDYDGAPTNAYIGLLNAVHKLGREEMARRWTMAKRQVAEDSFSFCNNPPVVSSVPTDWLPRIIPAAHWANIAAGVEQRLRALNRFLLDAYTGGQRVVPDEVLRSGTYYQPELEGITPPSDLFVHIYGIDLVHMGDGKYAVLEDNLRVPSGIAYQLKALQIGEQFLPEFRGEYAVVPYEIVPAYKRLFASLSSEEAPNTVLLTDGKHGSAFFEHRYLSDLLGIPLVEGTDLYVDTDHRVWCRSLDGAFPVHVIYRRVEDLEQFVPGLTRAYEKGNVALVNAPGAGAADDKLVFLWVPEMIRHYVNEEPLLYQARTYYPEEPDDFAVVADNLDSMVLKTRDGYGGHGVYIMPDMTKDERSAAAKALRERPDAFIAQEMIEFSRHLVFDEQERDFADRYIDLRVYAMQDADGTVTVFPGGLTRVAKGGTRVTNNSSGGACKPTWVVC